MPVHNSKESLPTLVESVLAQTYSGGLELLMVDDASTDGSLSSVVSILEKAKRSDSIQVRFLKTPRRVGPAAARNLGIRQAGGRFIAFTDADVVPAPNWIEEISKSFEEGVGGVAGITLTETSRLLYPLRIAPVNAEFATCNIAYCREVLEKCGKFDERFTYALREDSDLAYRVLEAGYEISCNPNAVVFHPVKKVSLRGLFLMARMTASDVLLYKKHPRRSKKTLDLVSPGITRRGLWALGSVMTSVLLITTLDFVGAGLALILFFVVITLAAARRRYTSEFSWRERYSSTIAVFLFALFVLAFHLIGSARFRKFLL